MDLTVEKQREYSLSGVPARLETRRDVLKRLRKVLVEHETSLADAVTSDLRRDARTTIACEIAPVIMEIDYALANLKSWSQTEVVQRTATTMLDTPLIYNEPYGVVLVIGAWNYPIFVSLMPMISVLAAGNTVILKPSEVAPASSSIISQLFSEAFDRRELAVVEAGIEGTTALLKEQFDFIVYTGNLNVGKIVMRAAAEHATPLILELGGKRRGRGAAGPKMQALFSPAIVLPDADLRIAAHRLMWGKLLNNGQTCVAPDYVLTTPQIKERLVVELRTAIEEFYGSNVQSSKDYSRIINTRHFDRISKLIEQTTGRLLHRAGTNDRNDLFIAPHIYEVERDDALMTDELFAPILPIRTVSNLQAALSEIRERPKPLALYVFSRDESSIQRVIESTSSGAVTVNDTMLHLTVDTLPFGGCGSAGFGHYRGKHGFDQFTHKKAVLKRAYFGESLAACRYPPMDDKKFKQLIRLSKRIALPTWLTKVFPLVLLAFIFGASVGSAVALAAWRR